MNKKATFMFLSCAPSARLTDAISRPRKGSGRSRTSILAPARDEPPAGFEAAEGLNSTLIQEKADLDECVGEGRGDHKCHNDETHRVCAKLVGDKETCKPLAWNKDGRNFWEITGQPTWQKDICKLGTNWCICMWATATLISDVGCDHVTLDCAATDVAHVMKSYEDTGVHGKVDLKPAKECLKQKCSKELGTGAANQQAGPAATRAPVAAGEEAKAAEDLASSSLR